MRWTAPWNVFARTLCGARTVSGSGSRVKRYSRRPVIEVAAEIVRKDAQRAARAAYMREEMRKDAEREAALRVTQLAQLAQLEAEIATLPATFPAAALKIVEAEIERLRAAVG